MVIFKCIYDFNSSRIQYEHKFGKAYQTKFSKTACQPTSFRLSHLKLSISLWKRIGTPLMLSYSILKGDINTTTKLNISPNCYIFIASSPVIFL